MADWWYSAPESSKIRAHVYSPPFSTPFHLPFLIPVSVCFSYHLCRLIGNWPNTYTYTKALAEDMVRRNSAGLPVGVFRPAIVTSSAKEPLVGWIDNLYGPTGVVAGAGTGVLRTMHCDKNINANIVPVDYCVNALIAAAWDVYHHYKELQCPGAQTLLNNMTTNNQNEDNNNNTITETVTLPNSQTDGNQPQAQSTILDCAR